MRSRGYSDAWTGEGMRREVFFFESRGVPLYGSLFAAIEISRPVGIVACNSWGVDADRVDPLQRRVAIEMARLGGAGLVFHYPGYGDSYGDLAEVDLATLTAAANEAVAEAARRVPGIAWILAGFMFGASVASLARVESGVKTLLLVQPELRPGAYFRWLAERRTPLAPGPSPREMMEAGSAPWMAYGYPIPKGIAEHAAEADAAVEAVLADFDGDGAVIRHEKPTGVDPAPESFECVTVPGTWRFGALDNSALARATVEWLGDRAEAAIGPRATG